MASHITIEPAGFRVVASLADGTVVAQSAAALVLREGSLPPRTYFPPGDVDMSMLSPTESSTHCPYKGDASYWSIGEHIDAAWAYRTPIDGVAEIADHISFYDTVVTVEAG